MVIALRGISQLGAASNGSDVTLTFDATTPPLEDDIVIVFGGHGSAITTLAAPGVGYTEIGINTGSAPIFGMWYKRMGVTPDLTVVCSGGGDSADAVCYGCATYSGVDTTTAEDATATTSGPTTSTNPDAPSITTATDDAFVLATAGGDVRDTSPGTVSGYTDQLNTNRNETNDLTIAFARIDAGTLGAEDPAAWSTWSSSTWYAITAALRPAGGAAPQDIDGGGEDGVTSLTNVSVLNQGLITVDIESSLHIEADTFNQGDVGLLLHGSAHIEADTFFDGLVEPLTISGSLLTNTSNLDGFQGTIGFPSQDIQGSVLANILIGST